MSEPAPLSEGDALKLSIQRAFKQADHDQLTGLLNRNGLRKFMMSEGFKKQRFGVDGELFKKRQELVKPIQDKVYNAIKATAERKGLGFVMDKAGQVSLLYANTKYDLSDDVLVYLGYKK